MQRPTAQLVPLVVLGLVVLAVSRASGEPFLDLYGGIADTESTRVTATDRNCTTVFPFLLDVCSPETKATRNVGFETSATYGVRGGYWFEPVPWVGLAGDLSYFEAEAPAARFRVVPLSLLVMLRLPLLATEEIPKGRLQPYVGLGPSIFFHEATVDFRDEGVRKVRLSSAELGFDARLGLAWQFHRHLGVFAEYRFTHLPISTDDESSANIRTQSVKATLDTHHLLGGVSIRF